ncbi:MAG TPA: hypothetical protein DCX07_05280 [Phycisphaerales bacterium]|nr:hypothetical protein [Phycisphaerales bacterium]
MLKGKQATLSDVSRLAGCSKAVASTVLNKARGNTGVSEQMRRRVLDAAARLDYRPNFASQSLIRRSSRTVGVYISPAPWAGAGFPYEGAVLRGTEASCRKHGYDLHILNLSGDCETQVCLDNLARRRVDGILLLHAERGDPWIRQMVQRRANVVAVDYPHAEPGLDAIRFDNRMAMELAVGHLVELGHSRIGFLGSCTNPQSADAAVREEAFLHFASARGLAVRPEWVHNLQNVRQPIRREEPVCTLEGLYGIEHLLGLADRPTAVIAYGDLVAVSALQAMHNRRMDLPREMSILGVDDSEICCYVHPPLTSVRHPLEEMGRRATDLLIARAEGKTRDGAAGKAEKGIHETFEPTLAVRESTAAPFAPSAG